MVVSTISASQYTSEHLINADPCHFSCVVICISLLLQLFLCDQLCSAFLCICASTAKYFELLCNLMLLRFLFQTNNPKSVAGFWLVMMVKQQDLYQLIISEYWAKEKAGKQWTWKGLQSNVHLSLGCLLEDPLLL